MHELHVQSRLGMLVSSVSTEVANSKRMAPRTLLGFSSTTIAASLTYWRKAGMRAQ